MNPALALTLITAAALTVTSPLRAAALEFGSAFSSGMVLQRDAGITVTGNGAAGETVNVSLGSQKRSIRVTDDGTWKAEFPPMKAGGPFVLDAADSKNKVSIDDLLIGDVWVCSGQSNMQMGLDEAIGGPEAIAAGSRETKIRVLTIPKAAADSPQVEIGAKWEHANPDSLLKFSAVAWFFAQALHDDPALADVPLGIINSSFGGTSIEAWSPKESLANFPEDQISGSMFGIAPGSLFNRMIHPLFSLKIKGAVWYQGEANAGRPEIYAKLLENMITQWRAGWNQPELPFLIVQLPAFEGKMGAHDFTWLREAQAKACRETPQTWLADTYDTTDGFDLHPREKQEIGRRLSLLARHEVHGEEIVAHGPAMTCVEIEGDKAIVTFNQTLNAAHGKPLPGFLLAGDDGDYRFARAISGGKQVTLTADGVPHPKTARYAWSGITDANLVNTAGLPATPFRTDTLAPQTLAFLPLKNLFRVETPAYELETGRLGNVSSLIARGKQFLSNEPNGGTSIPTFFGPRSLPIVRAKGPRRIAFADNNSEVEIACEDESMLWTVRNDGNDPIEFHIALRAQVKVESTGTSATLSREDVRLMIEGIGHADPGGKLIAKIPPHQSAVIRLTVTDSK